MVILNGDGKDKTSAHFPSSTLRIHYMIAELIASLSEAERRSLELKIAAKPTQLHLFIGELLRNPQATQKELQEKLGLASNTVFKNLSLAKDEIYEVIKEHLRNPYDDLLLPNLLYKRGLGTHASKLRIKLEQQYDQQGWWNVLQEFYSMEMIVAYAACDIPWLSELRDKAAKNIERMRELVLVGNDIIVLMATVEKGRLLEKEVPALVKKLRAALKRAQSLDHPVPIFNALHSLFVIHTQYLIDVSKANDIMSTVHDLVNNYDERLIPYARNVAWLNTMGFYAEFNVGISPEQFIKKAESGIASRSLLFDAQALLSICSYHFLERDVKRFDEAFKRYTDLPSEQSFGYKKNYLSCLHSYLHNDSAEFQRQRNEFYAQEENRAYSDYDLMIRYLEILTILNQKQFELAEDKLEAAKKFVRRHFSESRIKHEKHNWDLLTSAMGLKAKSSTAEPVFRVTRFLQAEMRSKKTGKPS